MKVFNQTRLACCLPFAVTVVLGFVGLSANQVIGDASKEPTDNAKSISKKALSEFNALIGGWRGTGQVRRGSTRGAWREEAEWIWAFKKNSVAVRYEVDKGKLLKSAELTYLPKEKLYQLDAILADKIKRTYTGKITGKKLIVETKPDKNDQVYRITVNQLNEKRTLVLFERRGSSQTFTTRIAEVGYTRLGTKLASTDASGPVCVVTGGTGTSKVSYKGQTYWVCCSGCREAFEEDPEGIIADYKKQLEEDKKKKAKKQS